VAGAERLYLDPNREVWAEQSVIGSMLGDPEVVGLVVAGMTEEDFLLEADRKLFRTFRARFNAGQVIDPVLVCQDTAPEDRQLRDYAVQLMDATPTSANIREYMEAARDNARLSRLRGVGQELAAVRTQEDGVRLLRQGQELLSDQGRDDEADMTKAALEFTSLLEQKPDFLPWGFPLLDESLNVTPGMLVVLGGRPSDGKTALALHMACTQAKTRNVGFFTLEDDRNTLFARLSASRSGVPLERILRRSLNDREYTLLAAASDELVSRKLTIIDSSGWSVGDVITRTHARKFDVIYIDYLQKLRPRIKGRGSRQEEVADISRELADMARRSGIVIVALAQLSRPADKAKRRSPLMADLKESGQIEQDANVILFVWREDETSSRTPRHLDLAKNKLGPLGTWGITFDGATQRFSPELTTGRSAVRRGESKSDQMTWEELTGQPDPDFPFQDKEAAT